VRDRARLRERRATISRWCGIVSAASAVVWACAMVASGLTFGYLLPFVFVTGLLIVPAGLSLWLKRP
jgi:hypothetical protein